MIPTRLARNHGNNEKLPIGAMLVPVTSANCSANPMEFSVNDFGWCILVTITSTALLHRVGPAQSKNAATKIGQ